MRRLAQDDDIAVAGPVLEQSPRLADADLVDIARTKSQAHLLAISGRTGIAETVTDELVRRGDRQVVRSVAENRQARLSERSFSTLVSRAEEDGVLAEKVGTRPDIPPRLFRDLLLKATEVVQQRLLAAAKPETQAEIRRVLARVSARGRQRQVARLRGRASARSRRCTSKASSTKPRWSISPRPASTRRWSRRCRSSASVPIDVVDRLMGGERPDPILILCKSAGWEWPTVKALIMARPGGKGASSAGLDTAFSNFERLSPATAQRVMRFWQARPAGHRREALDLPSQRRRKIR